MEKQQAIAPERISEPKKGCSCCCTVAAPPPDGSALSPLQKLLLEQRDKQVEQFMKINGQGAFAVLTVTFVVLFGADDVVGMLAKFDDPGKRWLKILLGVGVVLLAVGVLLLSVHHTGRIRRLQALCEAQKAAGVPAGTFELIPAKKLSFMPIFLGLAAIAVVALLVLVRSMETQPDKPKEGAHHASPAATVRWQGLRSAIV